MKLHSQAYTDYLRSHEWEKKRKQKLREVGKQCEMWKPPKITRVELGHGSTAVYVQESCSGNLEVHHKTYAHLGDEPMEDLMVLCEFHHKQADKERERMMVQAKEDRAVDTYASKKYGEQWSEFMNQDMVYEEFERWQQKKGQW